MKFKICISLKKYDIFKNFMYSKQQTVQYFLSKITMIVIIEVPGTQALKNYKTNSFFISL
jgi:hypothetical protein